MTHVMSTLVIIALIVICFAVNTANRNTNKVEVCNTTEPYLGDLLDFPFMVTTSEKVTTKDCRCRKTEIKE